MGYDVARLEETPSVSQHVSRSSLCSACHKIFEDPVEFPRCRHVFCRGCVSGRKRCLEDGCKEEKGKARLVSALQTAKSVEHLQVICRFQKEGCSQVHSIKEMIKHEVSCRSRVSTCQHECGGSVRYCERDRHDCAVFLTSELKRETKARLENMYTRHSRGGFTGLDTLQDHIKRLQSLNRKFSVTAGKVRKSLEERQKRH